MYYTILMETHNNTLLRFTIKLCPIGAISHNSHNKTLTAFLLVHLVEQTGSQMTH